MNTVTVFATLLDQNAQDQIRQIADHPALSGPIAIMPDAHAGAGCVIGFTGRFGCGVIPNIVGVDIGCGVAAVPLGKLGQIRFVDLDRFIREQIPLGMTSRPNDRFLRSSSLPNSLTRQAATLCEQIEHGFYQGEKIGRHTAPLLQLGTLGGGNHFIEIGRDQDGGYYLVVHSGSRNLGKRIAEQYQCKAQRYAEQHGLKFPRGLEYLPDDAGGRDYLRWMQVAQAYACLNRRMMLAIILGFFEQPLDEALLVESVHNYISEQDGLVRKGAISAHHGERVIIPLTMADGIILGTGKGNRAYNNSAPHGAGRLYGRKEMFRRLREGQFSLTQYADSMQHVYSTSVNLNTFDESVFAYKPFDAIAPHLQETVEIEQILQPVYNMKAAGD